MRAPLRNGLAWYHGKKLSHVTSKVVPTRDHLQAKLNNIYSDLTAKITIEDLALLTAIIGEIGNNCFDHNLGKWQDIPGCWLDYGIADKTVWACIGDRGQGVLASLKAVIPSLQNDQEALETAFQKVISGRSPEKRGNGLKFVRSIINGNDDRGLLFVSGRGEIAFGGQAKMIDEFLKNELKSYYGAGTFAVIVWRNKQ